MRRNHPVNKDIFKCGIRFRECGICHKTKSINNFNKKGFIGEVQMYRTECKRCYIPIDKSYGIKIFLDYKKRNPIKTNAQWKLRYEVKMGRIKKPLKCEICKEYFTKSKIHGHHIDYSKPLDVVWLCPQCHKDVHWPASHE